jgi:signal transduction histidine kinase
VSTTLEQRARDALAQYFGADRAEGLRAATELLSGDFEIADADTVLAMNLARVVMATNHIVNREFDPAVGLASQIQTDGERFDIPELRARALRLRALRELFAGSASTALRLNSEALDQALRSGQSRLVAALSLDTAAGFIALNGHEKAMPLLQRLHRMLAPEEASSSRFFAHVLHAEASLGLGRLDEAHEQIGLAIHSFGTKAGERGRIYAAVIEARISRMRNDHKADDYFELWIDRARKLRYEQAIGLLHAEHGWRALDADGDAAKASRRFDESIDLLTERADAGIRLDVHTALADAYTRLGEGELAREAMRHAMTYMRSERDHHLHEIRELLELDGDLLEKGKLRAAEEAQRVLLDEMVEQLRDVHGDLKKHLSEAMHDIRGPLTVLELITDSIGETPADSARQAGVARAASQQIADIVSLLETGVAKDVVHNTPFAKVLSEALPLYNRYAARKGSSVSLYAQTDSPVPTHVAILRRIANNLIENAVKFSPPGSAVAISLVERGPDLLLEIRDQGPGFRRHLRPAAPTAGETSTGFGLGIVRKLLEASDGRMKLLDYDEGGLVQVRWPLPGYSA